MADDRRSKRPGERGTGGKPTGRSSAGGSAPGGRSAPGESRSPRSRERSEKFDPRDSRGGSGRPARSGGSDSRRAPGSRDGRGGDQRGGDHRGARTADQAAYDGPDLPEEITGRELDRAISAQLKGLPEKLAARVARHLAAAGALLEEDAETAYQHTLAARQRAPRIAVVREAHGEAAYTAGHYAEALAELRAAKRMNGATAYLPMMADCHRALGHPEQAVKLAKSPSVANFSPEAKAEMTIVEAGARRDMGQLDAALRTLELAPLNSKNRAPWVVRLRYAYADTLVAAGRETDALTWFHRTHAIDAEQLTDAAERAEELEQRVDES